MLRKCVCRISGNCKEGKIHYSPPYILEESYPETDRDLTTPSQPLPVIAQPDPAEAISEVGLDPRG